MNRLSTILLIGFVILGGCAQPQTKTGQGAAMGAGIGAATGAAAGAIIGKDAKGALIGAAVGAAAGGLTGAAVGNYMDKQEAAMRQALAESEAASVRREMDMLAVTFKGDVTFDFDSAVLKQGAQDEIQRVAKVLTTYPQTTILVSGHTDDVGSEAYNQSLSERRADSVKNSLVAQGVQPWRITTVGYGESRPVADNSTEAGRQLNRRVEILIKPQESSSG